MKDLPDNVYLQGFWQSEKYFFDVAPWIRQEIQLQDHSLSLVARQQVERLRKIYGQVIALHIRRGDLAHAHEVLKRKDLTYGAPMPKEYIREALSLFDSKACFYVFSDTAKDIEWCKENLQGNNFVYSNVQSDILDFLSMRFCDHNIISNSTFSWWAAWLNDSPGRRVVAPRVWSTYGGCPMPTNDLIPRDWTVL
jgi:Glycosyl transferase family 11